MFALPTVPAVPGYTVEYSIDGGGTWSANPSTTTAGCYAVRARYVLAAACGSFPVGTPALAACQASNTVQITIFPAVTGTITSVNKSATCGNTDITLNWDVVPASPLVSGGATFEIQYSLDGGAYSATLPTGITPGCHTVEVRYALTAACGSTGAGTVSPGCGATRTFIVWPDLSTLRPSVTLSQNCAGPVNVTGVTLGTATPSIPAGMEFVYQGTNNGVAFGPVDIAGLTAMNFAFDGAAPSPGCHSIRATIRATTACGAAPDGAAAGDIMPVACRSLFRGFLSFPEPTAIEVDPVCTGGNLVVTPLTAAPTDHQWRYRLINNTTGTPVVGAWQASTTFVSPAVGCYTIEVTPVRLSTCFSISPVACSNGDPAAIFPSNHQNPLDNQNAC
ncbi:MAG TPA: hypothetical protein PK611_08920, partial [Saprospiraceae bacterium]|nr:hypothetical protein [Saprospiraceae bacterium]